MSKTTSKGKAPIQHKELEGLFFDESDSDYFAVPPKLKKAIKDSGFTCRLVNRKKYQEDGNFHRSGWKVYPVAKLLGDNSGSIDFLSGTDPEGYFRKGDLVLAIKPIEHQERHQKKISEKNKAQLGYTKQAAKELKEAARRAGYKDLEVMEGYESN